jgi:hypothetical protein
LQGVIDGTVRQGVMVRTHILAYSCPFWWLIASFNVCSMYVLMSDTIFKTQTRSRFIFAVQAVDMHGMKYGLIGLHESEASITLLF